MAVATRKVNPGGLGSGVVKGDRARPVSTAKGGESVIAAVEKLEGEHLLHPGAKMLDSFGDREERIDLTDTPKDAVLVAVVRAVARRLTAFSEEDLADLDVQQLAERAAALIPDPHPHTRLGPFYTTSSLKTWLGITRQGLDQKVKGRRLLGCPTTENGQRVYPTWQFRPDGEPLPHLREVLDTLHEGIEDPWSWATWLVAEVPGRFAGKPAHQWLAEDRDPEPVFAAARHTAARLAH